jgi:hypothetical protein
MAKDEETRRANNPKHSADRRGEESKGNGDNHETSVKLGGSKSREAKVEVRSSKKRNSVQTKENKTDNKQQQPVGEERIERKETENDGIVGAEVSQVEVDSSLSFAPGRGLGNSSEIEEVGGGLEIGKSVLEIRALSLC